MLCDTGFCSGFTVSALIGELNTYIELTCLLLTHCGLHLRTPAQHCLELTSDIRNAAGFLVADDG